MNTPVFGAARIAGLLLGAALFAALGCGTSGAQGTDAAAGGSGGSGGGGDAAVGGSGGGAGRGGSGGSGMGGSPPGDGGLTPPDGCSGVPPLKTTRVATGLARPLYVTQAAGDARLFVVEQGGRIRVVRDGQTLAQPFLDISGSLVAAPTGNDEKGLLGLAMHPQYAQANNGRFFVFYNRGTGDPFSTGGAGDVVVAEGQRSSNADVAMPTLRPLFVITQNRNGHTGGMLAFGPDGMLYIGNGDAVDPPSAQDRNAKTGKILRVNVGSGPPAAPNLNPEVVHYGLRNPWRFSFDRLNGNLYIADVGEELREEVDVAMAGQTGLNFGWPIMEGSMCAMPGCSMTGLTLPIYDYGRDNGRCIIGGYVYRGQNIACLRGRYIFGDCDFSSPVYSFVPVNGQATDPVTLTSMLNPETGGVSSLGEDVAGELYVITLDGSLYRIDPQ